MLIIENISGAQLSIDDLGFALGIGGSLDLIFESDPVVVAASAQPGGDLHAAINGGAVVVKDPLDGVTNLSAADGIAACQVHNDTHYRMPIGGRVIDIPDVNAPGLVPGEILEWDGVNWINVEIPSASAEVHDAMQEPTGHVNRVDSEISFDEGTRTFTIQPRAPATEYDFYIKGIKHTITTTKTYVIPDVTGLYFIYFDSNDDLQHQSTFTYDLMSIYAYCAIVYWNSAQGKAIYVGDERHGITMDGQTHAYLHLTVGTQFIQGLAVNGTLNPDVGVPLDADVQIDVGNGHIRDEDLEHHIADTGTGTQVFDLTQELSPTAQIPVYWRTGASGDWNISTAGNFPFLYSDGVHFTGASGRPPWNEWTGATWQLTELDNNRFFLIHILATNDINNPIVAIQGIQEYQNKPAGRDAASAELGQLTGLPFEEYFPVTTIIMETRDVYTNTPKVRARLTDEGEDYIDWRYTDSFVFKVIGGGVNDHGNLTGLLDDDHPQYALAGTGSTRTFDFTDLNDVNVANGPGIDTYILSYNDAAGEWQAIAPPSGSTDELAKVSANDTTAGFLNGKLISGAGITLTENNDGGNETLSIINSAPNVDQNLFNTISVAGQNDIIADTTTDTLTVVAGAGISITTDETTDTLTITSTVGVGSDELVKVSANDTTAGYLNGKLVAGTGITLTENNDGANETLTIASTAADQNLWETINADTGSTTANTTTDTLTVAGGLGIDTEITGDQLDIILNAGIDDLNDVTITGPIPDNARIKYDLGTGQWVNAPDVPAPPPGGELMVQLVWSPIGALSGTATIPRDGTPPLITEGIELWNADITPTETTSTIRVASSFTWFHTNASRNLAIAVFRGTTCVGVAEDTVADNTEGQTVHFVIYDTPATTSTVTYSVRVGKAGGGPGTFYINSHTTIANLYGGLMENNAYSIEEIGSVA